MVFESKQCSENMKQKTVSFSRFTLWLESEIDKTLAAYIRARIFLALLSRGFAVKKHRCLCLFRIFPIPTNPTGLACAFRQPCLN